MALARNVFVPKHLREDKHVLVKFVNDHELTVILEDDIDYNGNLEIGRKVKGLWSDDRQPQSLRLVIDQVMKKNSLSEVVSRIIFTVQRHVGAVQGIKNFRRACIWRTPSSEHNGITKCVHPKVQSTVQLPSHVSHITAYVKEHFGESEASLPVKELNSIISNKCGTT